MGVDMFEMTVPISGMTCVSCVSHLERAIGEVPGVAEVHVNLTAHNANVRFNKEGMPVQSLIRAVHGAGYEITIQTVNLPIGGMTCASCASHVETAIRAVPGVLLASVNLETEHAKVTFVPGVAELEEIRQGVASSGYQVLDLQEGENEPLDQEAVKMKEARFRMWVAWAFTIPIIIWMLVKILFHILWPSEAMYNLGMIVLAVPVLAWVGRKTYLSAWAAITHRHTNMDSLIALVTIVSLLTGPASFFWPVANYAGVAAMLMAFHLTGRSMDENAKGRTSQAIHNLP